MGFLCPETRHDFTADEAAKRQFLEEKPRVWCATFLRDGRWQFATFNPERSEVRVRSDLTHEVSHFETEHDPSPTWTSEDSSCDGRSKEQELEAPELAGALLVPQASAKLAAIRGVAPRSVAMRYRASVEMAEWRMRKPGGYNIREKCNRESGQNS